MCIQIIVFHFLPDRLYVYWAPWRGRVWAEKWRGLHSFKLGIMCRLLQQKLIHFGDLTRNNPPQYASVARSFVSLLHPADTARPTRLNLKVLVFNDASQTAFTLHPFPECVSLCDGNAMFGKFCATRKTRVGLILVETWYTLALYDIKSVSLCDPFRCHVGIY